MTKKRKIRSGGTFSTITSCISTSLVLILLGIVVFFALVATNFSRSLRENFALEVLLNDSITQQEAYAVQTKLRSLSFVRYTNYISKEQGTQDMAAALEGGGVEFLGASPIPAEFEVYLAADYANSDSLKKFLPLVRDNVGVSDVIYPKDAMDFVNYVIPAVGLVLLIVAGLLVIVSFALINNTIRMGVYSHRFTINSMKLVGAPWRYIRRPFMLRALAIGFIAALVADGLIATGIYFLLQMDSYVTQLVTPLVIGITLGTVLLFGLLLTLLCAYVSVNRHLRMTSAEVYIK